MIVAFDLVDLDQDGDDDLIAWNRDLGIAQLSLETEEWLISPYVTERENVGWLMAVLPIDADANFDVVVSPTIATIAIGISDGAGHYQFGDPLAGLHNPGRVALAPDRVRLVGLSTGLPGGVVLVRFDEALQPSTFPVPAPAAAQRFMPAEFDAAIGEELLVYDNCSAYAIHHVGVDDDQLAATKVEFPEQYDDLTCQWIAADLDGDGRDELIGYEDLRHKGPVPVETLLSVFDNETEPDADPTFDPRKLARLPTSIRYTRSTALDLDGDGRDELLFSFILEHRATLLWAGAAQHLGCQASLPTLPDDIRVMRGGDLDGDGDDELFVLRSNGALVVYDGHWD